MRIESHQKKEKPKITRWNEWIEQKEHGWIYLRWRWKGENKRNKLGIFYRGEIDGDGKDVGGDQPVGKSIKTRMAEEMASPREIEQGW